MPITTTVKSGPNSENSATQAPQLAGTTARPTTSPVASAATVAPKPPVVPLSGSLTTIPPMPKVTVTMAQQANSVAGTTLSAGTLAKLKARTFNTKELSARWLHAIIYGPTDARKSTSAAEFGSPEDVRIILVRNREQLLPVMDKGYIAFHAETWAQLSMALKYPEQIWPEWAKRPNRTLILDDMTEGKDLAMEDNETTTDAQGNSKEVADLRKVVRGAKEDIRDVIKSVLRKPLNFIIVCMAREWDTTKDQGNIAPDLPQSISNLVTTDFEYVFYVKKDSWEFITAPLRLPGTRRNEKNKDEAYTRTIFAKHKVPKELVGKVLKVKEKMDLREIWTRIQNATKAFAAGEFVPVTPIVEEVESTEVSDGATQEGENSVAAESSGTSEPAETVAT